MILFLCNVEKEVTRRDWKTQSRLGGTFSFSLVRWMIMMWPLMQGSDCFFTGTEGQIIQSVGMFPAA